MKCQICGKNEVSFHYSTNVNGCVTDTHLCSECAERQGYNIGQLFDTRNIFGGFFPIFGEQPVLPAVALPVFNFNSPMTFRMKPMIAEEASCSESGGCECERGLGFDSTNAGVLCAEVDDEMKERRELRMQMQLAARNEDFETAAKLRDRIKEIES